MTTFKFLSLLILMTAAQAFAQQAPRKIQAPAAPFGYGMPGPQNPNPYGAPNSQGPYGSYGSYGNYGPQFPQGSAACHATEELSDEDLQNHKMLALKRAVSEVVKSGKSIVDEVNSTGGEFVSMHIEKHEHSSKMVSQGCFNHSVTGLAKIVFRKKEGMLNLTCTAYITASSDLSALPIYRRGSCEDDSRVFQQEGPVLHKVSTGAGRS